MNRHVVFMSAIVLFATSTPVLAEEYWVEQDPTTKQCQIVDKMPDGKTSVMVGATSYPDKAAARAAVGAGLQAGVCVKKTKD
jgi:hypothetical protein